MIDRNNREHLDAERQPDAASRRTLISIHTTEFA